MTMAKKENKMPSIPTADLRVLCDALQTIYALEAEHAVSLMHNYAWREWLQLYDAQSHFEDLRLLSGTHGADAMSKNHDKIEFKSCKVSRLKKSGLHSRAQVNFEFDKQDKPQRRKETLGYDAFVFSAVNKSAEIAWSVIANTDIAVESVISILSQKQKAFVKILETVYKVKGKESRDTIMIKYDDLLMIEDAIYQVDGVTVTRETFKSTFAEITSKEKK
jgi:hypothetical protein